jgi:hypothetical protein
MIKSVIRHTLTPPMEFYHRDHAITNKNF